MQRKLEIILNFTLALLCVTLTITNGSVTLKLDCKDISVLIWIAFGPITGFR
jgi:hypothetical protein